MGVRLVLGALRNPEREGNLLESGGERAGYPVVSAFLVAALLEKGAARTRTGGRRKRDVGRSRERSGNRSERRSGGAKESREAKKRERGREKKRERRREGEREEAEGETERRAHTSIGSDELRRSACAREHSSPSPSPVRIDHARPT